MAQNDENIGNKDDSDPTIIISDNPEQDKYELLKEKLRYKQAKRENNKKIDHKQVRLNIQANALPSKTFFIMNTLAGVIAGYGLLANSPAVVIGAMLVAMMTGPISGIALALIDNRMILLGTSLKTLLGGIGLLAAVGILLGVIHYNMPMSEEILARTRPNSMDLMIALAGGAAGAFASISARLSVAVVGVAVATALVPPLVAMGILLAHFEWKLALGAFILVFTNMVAIQFSSSLVLWIAGFRRVTDEEVEKSAIAFIKRNFVSLIMLSFLAVYLTLNLLGTVEKQHYQASTTKHLKVLFSKQNNVIDQVQYIPYNNFILIRVMLQGDIAPSKQEVLAAQKSLSPGRNGLPVKLQVRFAPVTIIQPELLENLSLTSNEANSLAQQ
ncbi:hypothetical protein BKE30_09570 [Alkanindiges hydrocarboniclasticus]|uniref:TIGR00341 family protein n=1 Tax=Alkanindiges hydrocarboniclasticus TaxID=1907941 RepID=A0A1S8CTE4_9GAMM|nr:DUF389 domain-containing protein [Alkanindiges hydrocarboniclasticus]ONG39588.1 hypothetical protein BKE30_09570 [Alkanindiges hydrocarboniclasticus]